MKSSPSTSSLIELNPNDPTCFVCLELTNEKGEAIVDGKDLRMCGCQFFVHPICWNTWLSNGKTEFDCPICRRAIIGKEVSEESVRRVRTHSFPYADESYSCCIEFPEMNTYRFMILVGVILIFSLFLFVGLLKR